MNSDRIIFITGNRNKFEEARAVLPGLQQVAIDLPEVQAVASQDVIAAKLRAAAGKIEGTIIVEDTALHCTGLGELPGSLIKWFLDCLGVEGLFRQVHASGDCTARAVCTVGLRQGENFHFFESVIDGQLVSPRGTGFGWDALFQPAGSDKTYGEMSAEEKRQISMRTVVFTKVRDHILA